LFERYNRTTVKAHATGDRGIEFRGRGLEEKTAAKRQKVPLFTTHSKTNQAKLRKEEGKRNKRRPSGGLNEVLEGLKL